MVCFSKDIKVPVKVRRTLSSVGTSSSNTTDKILQSFLQTLLNVHHLPNYATLISQLGISTGGLGMLCPQLRAAPNFVLTMTFGLPLRHLWLLPPQRPSPTCPPPIPQHSIHVNIQPFLINPSTFALPPSPYCLCWVLTYHTPFFMRPSIPNIYFSKQRTQ